MRLVHWKEPELRALLEGLARGGNNGKPDPSGGLVLADWLEEQDDARAADVREIASARCVIPALRADIPRRKRGRLRVPMACGRCWAIYLTASGLETEPTEWSPWPWYLTASASLPLASQTEPLLREAFASCQVQLVLGLLALAPDDAGGLVEVAANYFEDDDIERRIHVELAECYGVPYPLLTPTP